MTRTTVAMAKASRIPEALNISPLDPRFIQYLNESEQRLLYRGKFWGTYGRYNIKATSQIITLPPQIDEEVVTQKALTWAYRDAESRKDIMAAKGSGGNYLALKKQAEEDFLKRIKTLRLLDRDAVDSYMVEMKAATRGFSNAAFFNSSTMRSGPWGG